MKNKSTLLALAFAATVTFAPSAFAQSLLFSFHNFDGTTNSETRDGGVSGFASATLTKSALGSGATGGSSDGFFGPSGIVAPTNDGYVILSQSNPVTIVVTNNSGFDYTLDRLLFDARVITIDGLGQLFAVSYVLDSDSSVPMVLNTPVVDEAVDLNPETQDYTDFRSPAIGSSSILFPSQSTLTFTFETTGASHVGLDNIALYGFQGDPDLTIIPEPGSMLALGCILTSGLALRSRRRAVKAS